MAEKKDSVITVFTALCLCVITALLLAFTESACTAAAKIYFETAAAAGMESLFSNYHRELWEKYRVLGLEEYSDREIEEELREYISPYFDEELNRNWYGISFPENGIRIAEKTTLVSDGAEPFRKEVLSYMKYAWIPQEADKSDVEAFLALAKEGAAAGEASSLFDGAKKIAEQMDRSVTSVISLSESLEREQAKLVSFVRDHRAGESGDRIVTMLSHTGKLQMTIRDFEQRGDDLWQELLHVEEKLSSMQAGGELSASSAAAFAEEKNAYLVYASEEGELRTKMRRASGLAADYAGKLEDLYSMLTETVSEDTGEPDWEELADFAGKMEVPDPEIARGEGDEKKRKALDEVTRLLGGGLLELVLPEGAEIRKEEISIPDAPSGYLKSSGTENTFLEKLFLSEYLLRKFRSYEAGGKEQELEAEYVLYGKDSDRENLSAFASEFVAVYTGVDLLALLSDSAKRAEARTLALAITGAVGAVALTEPLTFAILSVWAVGQATCDLKAVFEGKKIPVIRRASDFTLSLEGLLSGKLEGQESKGPGTAGYREYLRLFSVLHMGGEQIIRMTDVIQADLRREQDDFLMERLLTDVRAEVSGTAEHMFSPLGEYRIFCESQRTYLERR